MVIISKLSLTQKLLLAGAVFFAFSLNANSASAAVPVWVVNFDACTEYETSLENILLSTLTSLEQKYEDFVKTFELGKIEKAREDVTKLMYETLQELKDEALLVEAKKFLCDEYDDEGNCIKIDGRTAAIFRGRGILVKKVDDSFCPGGFITDPWPGSPSGTKSECVLIKKEGRIITNVDDYLYEEPIQKARDFLYCYLGPWKYFPVAGVDDRGDNYENCSSVGLEANEEACSMQKFCLEKRKTGEQCEADKIRDLIKFQMLAGIARKAKHLDSAITPPESWYSPERCKVILGSVPEKTAEGFNDTLRNLEQAMENRNENPTLETPIQLKKNFSIQDILKALNNQNNTITGVIEKASSIVNQIISQYHEIRKAEYLAGQGLRPEKYMIGWIDRPDVQSKKDEDKLKYGRELIGYTGEYYYFTTEDVITPAVVLLQKMAAATQAEFDLARQAYKFPADQSESKSAKLKNECVSKSISIISPTISQLPAPWEDTGAPHKRGGRGYTEVPKSYRRILKTAGGKKGVGRTETEPQEPKLLGEFYYLNRWYKDVIELYEHSFGKDQPMYQPAVYGGKLLSVLKKWFRMESQKPIIPPAIPPTEGPPQVLGCKGPYTGASDPAKASQILANNHSFDPPSCGTGGAQQNLQDIAAGNLPQVCSPSCSCSAGGGQNITIDPQVLDLLITLKNEGFAFKINSFTGGSHANGSCHYSGKAVDVAFQGDVRSAEQRARELGFQVIEQGSDAAHANHTHIQIE